MKIIDFEKKGNLVRFWLGDDDCNDYWGDDWDDAPYDCNAGVVSFEYIKGYKDICFPFEWVVAEPCDGAFNCHYSKEDMKVGFVPCIVADDDNNGDINFANILAKKSSKKYYFEDKLEPDMLCEWDNVKHDFKYIAPNDDYFRF